MIINIKTNEEIIQEMIEDMKERADALLNFKHRTGSNLFDKLLREVRSNIKKLRETLLEETNGKNLLHRY